jgi:RNA polymerase sigma-70 factor (ECF subfamily)
MNQTTAELFEARDAEGRYAGDTDLTEGWSADPDVQLMLRVRAGDADAFCDLYHRHRKGLIHHAYRFVGDFARAEDLVQEAFLQVYRARARYEPRARFGTYLYRVMTNICLNDRRQARKRTESLADTRDDRREASTTDRRSVDMSDSPEEHLVGIEVAERLRSAMQRIYPNQAAALEMSRIQGLSYREVADSLDTSVSAVKSLVFRATRILRQDLREWEGSAAA